MYTVKELIETLKQCPEDYEVVIQAGERAYSLDMVGIDNDLETVDLFGVHADGE